MMRKLLLALLLVPIAACDRCETGERNFIIDAPDPDLAALLQTCLNPPPCSSGGPECTPPECLAVCRRAAELARDATAENSMTQCYVKRVADGGTAVEAYISFDTCR
jgi:hypothetical protein